MSNRGREEIMASILRKCRVPTLKTHVLYGCNLSVDSLRGYLLHLIRLGLLEVKHSKRPMYHTTLKGKHWLKAYKKLKEIEGEVVKQ